MKTETQAWSELRQHAASRLRPGFADRVLRAARPVAQAAPTLFGIFALSAATAALCFAAVTVYTASHDTGESDRNLADWQRIISDADEFASNP